MDQMELLIDLHRGNPRQGPGSTASTLRALKACGLPREQRLRVADIGCGSGAQTLVLAEELEADIVAVDLFPEFTEELNHRAVSAGFHDSIKTANESMEALSLESESVDLIWSEGAIYSMGFKAGLQAWRPFLRPNGVLAVSEITWTTTDRPQALEEFWGAEYPEVGTAEEKMADLRAAGYQVLEHFFLPPSDWLDEYYLPLEQSFEGFLDRHQHSKEALQVVQLHRDEIEFYRTYQAYYSYGFYIAQKV
ncbi:methyltransferase domain-containing protein [Cryomorphaceae bacterium]|nr:methyltransferase domain-containing protein [Cryomorphaceae bacterium]